MIDLTPYEVWFVTGSQHLYGPDALKQVADDAKRIAVALDAADRPGVRVVFKPVLTRPEEVAALCHEANADRACVGLIAWMHTFSPAKMWIAGLDALRKPLCHLHTQFGRDLPYATIDMDFMNLHQSAHGGREFGYIGARLRLERKVVVGHWEQPDVRDRLDAWARAALALADQRTLKVARIGDNMRHVAVTDGDKVEAQRVFGYEVHGYGVGDVVQHVDAVTDAQVDALCERYADLYTMADDVKPGGARHASVRDAARIELGLRAFLDDVGAHAYTDTFENLHGLKQLPGIASQRLMADGFGFGAEGDWKTAALLRAMKVMAHGRPNASCSGGGTSFMEDYTYHFDPAGPAVLGAHMLEVCPSIAAETSQPALEVHPLGIGGKEDPARLVFDGAPGDAINASVVDLGDRFRLLLNPVEAVPPSEALPNLPVARALWRPLPDLATAAACWIHAGGAHHTGYSLDLTTEPLEDFADMVGIETVVIDADTKLRTFKNELRQNAAYWRLAGGV
ncbi:MAG: L-arabinose isomerase [Planctomycetota bacterium]